jgi:hypothetical protein
MKALMWLALVAQMREGSSSAPQPPTHTNTEAKAISIGIGKHVPFNAVSH